MTTPSSFKGFFLTLVALLAMGTFFSAQAAPSNSARSKCGDVASSGSQALRLTSNFKWVKTITTSSGQVDVFEMTFRRDDISSLPHSDSFLMMLAFSLPQFAEALGIQLLANNQIMIPRAATLNGNLEKLAKIQGILFSEFRFYEYKGYWVEVPIKEYNEKFRAKLLPLGEGSFYAHDLGVHGLALLADVNGSLWNFVLKYSKDMSDSRTSMNIDKLTGLVGGAISRYLYFTRGKSRTAQDLKVDLLKKLRLAIYELESSRFRSYEEFSFYFIQNYQAELSDVTSQMSDAVMTWIPK